MIKFTSKFLPTGASCLALVALCGPAASATDLLDTTTSITASSPTQLGRISRNGVQQTWDPADDGETAYPGTINNTTAYSYTTFTFTPAQIGNGQFVQVDFEEPNGAGDLFASAWTSYAGTSSVQSGSGWLGDAGASTDYAFTSIPPTPQDPRFFNVTVPVGDSLTVVVNTSATTGVGENFNLEVEAFSDTEYDPATPSAVPEPSTWAMLGVSALLGGLAVFRRRNRVA